MEERKDKDDDETEVCEIVPPMETPERKQIGTPIPKFEDSPVFNYINNLSPINTFRPTRISQTFNSFNFASLPPVFASPYANSIKESLLRRHQLPDSSRPTFTSEKGNEVDSSDAVTVTHGISNGQNESSNPVNSVGEGSTKPNAECTNLSVEISKLNSECCSPNRSSTPRGSQIGSGLEMAIVPFDQEMSGIDVSAEGLNISREKQVQHNKESGCDWKSLISDSSDLLIFDSPGEAQTINTPFLKSLDACTKVVDRGNDHMTNAVSSDVLPHHEMTIPSHEQDGHLKETDASENGSIPTSQIDSAAMSHLHFSMRRRCLVYEMSGARMRHLGGEASSSGSSRITQQDANIEIKDNKELVPARSGNDSSHCILNGIGLHLNALARTKKSYNEVAPENLVSERQLIDDHSSIGTVPLTANQELDLSLVVVSEEKNIEPADNGVLVAQDASEASMYIAGEELSQNSPKKKRRRSESGEIEGCKRCNCKKSKCLKLYCECFAAGVYCVEPCSCQECFNKPVHEDTVLATRKQIESRNPMAFAPKVISVSDSKDESNMTPASARHKRGCNCKKSGCLKKYCECYQGGVGCSINCRCEGCKNAFGRKDGSILIAPEVIAPEDTVMEENDTETREKQTIDKKLDKTAVINKENFIDAFPATPLRTLRGSMEVPFSSKGRLRSNILTIGSSSGLNGRARFGKSNFLPPTQSKKDKQQGEDEIPEVLNNNNNRSSSPGNKGGIKAPSSSSSPNSKRVSPPECGIGTSPGMRSRKLILQSIPSFPALTPKH